MRSTSRALALGSMLGSVAFGSGALAEDGSEVDLTGTWEGAQICDDLIEGEFANFVDDDHRLLIVQDGDTFRLLYTAKPEGEIADDLVYEGIIQTVEGSDHFEALGRHLWWRLRSPGDRPAAADRNLGSRGPLRCRTRSSSPMTSRRSEGDRIFETCKWAYERVSTEPPDVPECQRPGIRPTKR